MHDPTRRLNERDAHQILARAADLDRAQGRTITVAELRAVAIEVGIASDAFDRAADEQLASGREDSGPSAGRWAQVTANVKAIAFFWVTLGMLAAACRVFGADGSIRTLADVLALALGAIASHRLGARLARIGFVGLTAGLSVQLILQLVFGMGAVQGLANQLAVIGAGIFGALGAAIALRFERPKRPGYPSAETLDAPGAKEESEASPIDMRALKLRAV